METHNSARVPRTSICICIYSLGLLIWSSNFCAQRQRIINKLLSVNVTRATSLDQINQDADGFIKRQQNSTWPRANRSWSWPIPTVIFTHYQSTSNSYWRASSIAGQAAAASTGTHGRDTKPLEWEYERESVPEEEWELMHNYRTRWANRTRTRNTYL